ncbi:MAG: amidohydrolase family protein [Thermoplasmata archaeon]
MKYVTGKLLTEEGFVSGHVGFEDGVIKEVGRGQKEGALAKGLIIPSLVNAHTHLGDSCLRPRLWRYRGERTVEALLAPPTGFKHRELSRVPARSLERGIRSSIVEMLRSGVRAFCDFREGGVRGVAVMKRARAGLPLNGLVLGRPTGLSYNKEEVDAILRLCDGIGVSAAADWDYGELRSLSAYVHSRGKLFALHASEVVRENIDMVLDLRPDFLVHMIKAEGYDLEKVAEAGIPVVVCPRANAFFGLRPQIPRMLSFGIDVALGTDNAMLSPPSLLPTLQSAWELSSQEGTKPLELLRCAILGFRKVINGAGDISLRPGEPARFFVAGGKELYAARDPARALVSKGERARVVLAVLGDRLWAGKVVRP